MELSKLITNKPGIYLIRHSDRPSGKTGFEVEITTAGIERCKSHSKHFTQVDSWLSSSAVRCVQTAEYLGAGENVQKVKGLTCVGKTKLGPNWKKYKKEKGWIKLLEAWVNKELDSELNCTSNQVASTLLKDIYQHHEKGNTAVAVTHDLMITCVYKYLTGKDVLEVPFAGGIFLEDKPQKINLNNPITTLFLLWPRITDKNLDILEKKIVQTSPFACVVYKNKNKVSKEKLSKMIYKCYGSNSWNDHKLETLTDGIKTNNEKYLVKLWVAYGVPRSHLNELKLEFRKIFELDPVKASLHIPDNTLEHNSLIDLLNQKN